MSAPAQEEPFTFGPEFMDAMKHLFPILLRNYRINNPGLYTTEDLQDQARAMNIDTRNKDRLTLSQEMQSKHDYKYEEIAKYPQELVNVLNNCFVKGSHPERAEE